MLLEFSCSNHKSIRKDVLFSALAGTDTTKIEDTKEFGKYRVLKSAVIYGANGSGKSNFLDAISFVKNLVLNSIHHQPGQGIRQVPFKTEGYEVPSVYKIQFVIDNIRYVYQFSLKQMLVEDEYFYFFPNGKQKKVFERHGDTFTAGRSYRGKFDSCKDVLKPNRLMLSCAANFSTVHEVEEAYQFFRDDIVIYGDNLQDNWMNYSLHAIDSNATLKNAVITFMQELGMGVKDIAIKIDQSTPEPNDIPPFLAPEFREKLLNAPMDRIDAKVVYDNFDTNLIGEESSGVKKLFAFLCPLIDIIVNGKVLICDELESGLHEALVYGLLKMFMTTDSGDKFPQLFFTTQDTGLLNLDMFRRDQIWFTELKEDRSTDLYSLAEIQNVRKDENIRKGYINGKYGAIPMLNLNFENIILSMNVSKTKTL